ncbi:MAG: hypothetical protein EOO20_00295 [Chryseobacterium sp.]|nr:MAG: hypothetical protein EOO20_00295 [Chryseobacterium sp.]
MEKENSNFYVKELDGIRKIFNDLIYDDVNCILETEELFMVKIDGLALQLERDIQNRQLHLDNEAATFMGHLQIELSQLSEDCDRLILAEATAIAKKERKIYFEILANSINSLFEALIEDYAYCFNFQMKVPPRLKSKTNLLLSREWNKLLAKLRVMELDEALIDVLSSYWQEIRLNKRVSFEELKFWHAITNALREIDFKKTTDIAHSLYIQFCCHNFNYGPLVLYSMSRMQRDYDNIENYREEFIKITIQLKTLKQLTVEPDHGYNQNAAPLQDVLCNILENELLCLKKLMNMNRKTLAGNGAKFFLKQFYFKVTVSIELFLFIFRLMIEKGIILVNRKADLFEFLHSHVGTINKDNLSIGNMQNTFSENNRKTAIRAKALLQSLITHIDEKYLSIFVFVSVI